MFTTDNKLTEISVTTLNKTELTNFKVTKYNLKTITKKIEISSAYSMCSQRFP